MQKEGEIDEDGGMLFKFMSLFRIDVTHLSFLNDFWPTLITYIVLIVVTMTFIKMFFHILWYW